MDYTLFYIISMFEYALKRETVHQTGIAKSTITTQEVQENEF